MKNNYLSPTIFIIRLEATSFIAASGGTIGGGGYEGEGDEILSKENNWLPEYDEDNWYDEGDWLWKDNKKQFN